jgi:hypothetical protein
MSRAVIFTIDSIQYHNFFNTSLSFCNVSIISLLHVQCLLYSNIAGCIGNTPSRLIFLNQLVFGV